MSISSETSPASASYRAAQPGAIAGAVFAAAILVSAGCGSDADPSDGPVENAAEETGEAIDEGIEETGEAMEEAGEEIEEAAE